ncbi:MAG: polysaccharide deacetylase family protein [Nitrospira sp.]|nr:polysaccharide deacetylase family protein [Nitrospira sp.]
MNIASNWTTGVRIPVLMYHRIGIAKNFWEQKYCVSPEWFSSQMRLLARSGWTAIPLSRFFAWLDEGDALPPQAFLLTFDDGFLGVHQHAAPVLADLGWTATVFLVSQLIGQRDDWCVTHNPSGETYPLMAASHIRELCAQGFTFQSHTRNHADLPTLDDDTLRAELMGSRDDLQDLLGKSVDYLAYPYGHHDVRVINATRAAGYQAAFSVQPGFNRLDVDRFRLRRLDVFGTDTPAMLARKITLGSNDGSLSAQIRYNTGRVLARLGLKQR